MNNENIMNNENVEAVVEAVKATKVEKAGAIALVVFATVGVAYTVSKGYQLGKKAIAKYLPKKPEELIAAAEDLASDAIDVSGIEEMKERLKK